MVPCGFRLVGLRLKGPPRTLIPWNAGDRAAAVGVRHPHIRTIISDAVWIYAKRISTDYGTSASQELDDCEVAGHPNIRPIEGHAVVVSRSDGISADNSARTRH